MSSLKGHWSIQSVESKGGSKIRYGLYRRSQVPMKRCVLFLNGRTEWIEKYYYLPDSLNLPDDTGFLTLDHRGQGASAGKRAHIDSYDTFAEDVSSVVRTVLEPSVPYVLLTHSMGGLIGLYSILIGRISPRSAVICSPLLGLPEEPIPSIIARPLSRVLSFTPLKYLSSGAGQFSKGRFENNMLTHDRGMFEKIQNSPYPLPGVTFGWVNATFCAMSKVFDKGTLKCLTVPVLILGGGADHVVNAAAFGQWVQVANQCSKATVQFVSVPEARHELLTESEKYRNQTLEHVRQWFKAFLS